jgi:hypothetical protein
VENLIEEGACVDMDSDFNSESMLGNLRLGKNSELALMATDIPLRVICPPTPNSPHCSVALDEQCTGTITFCFFVQGYMARALVFLQWGSGRVTAFCTTTLHLSVEYQASFGT